MDEKVKKGELTVKVTCDTSDIENKLDHLQEKANRLLSTLAEAGITADFVRTKI